MIKIDSNRLTLSVFEEIIFQNRPIGLDDTAIHRTMESFNFLKSFSKGKIIYGVNTGFGPMAQHVISSEDQTQLQLNLIRSHCTGAGHRLTEPYVRAAMIARLNTLSLGYSGVHQSTLDVLLALINQNITPLMFEHGGVGASGDLVQLAHLALVMLGEGEVIQDGERKPAKDVFESLEVKPMEIHIREGLAIINGTGVMTGIGIINTVYARRALEWSVMASAIIAQLVNSFDDYYSRELNATKKHKGQQDVARVIDRELKASKCGQDRGELLYKSASSDKVLDKKLQEYYSIRCVPQIGGPVLDTLRNCRAVLEDELNSVNDNPVVDVENENVYHGGNFHGDYVSLEMDKLKLVVTKLSMLAERQINFLMNPALNRILAPFVNLGTPGLNYGLQGLQFTATSTTAENQTLSNPMYVHSIPNNNDNQDVVSMGTNAALITRRVIENTFEVLAVELLSIVQAIDFAGKSSDLSPNSQRIYQMVRDLIPSFSEDQPLYESMDKLKAKMMEQSPVDAPIFGNAEI